MGPVHSCCCMIHDGCSCFIMFIVAIEHEPKHELHYADRTQIGETFNKKRETQSNLFATMARQMARSSNFSKCQCFGCVCILKTSTRKYVYYEYGHIFNILKTCQYKSKDWESTSQERKQKQKTFGCGRLKIQNDALTFN